MVKKNLDKFKDDEYVKAIYATSEEIKDYEGYEAYPFRIQHLNGNDQKEAKKELKEVKKAVIRMHKYVMKKLGI